MEAITHGIIVFSVGGKPFDTSGYALMAFVTQRRVDILGIEQFTFVFKYPGNVLRIVGKCNKDLFFLIGRNDKGIK